MVTRRRPWHVVLGVFLAMVAVGVLIVVGIVTTEGPQGLFDRKRKALEVVMPEALPVLDKIEEQVPREKPIAK